MTGDNLPESTTSITNPVTYLTGALRKDVDAIPPEIMAMTMDQLEQKYTISHIDYFLRQNLWKSIGVAQKLGKTEIPAVSIFEGVCSAQNFEGYVRKNPYRLAWILMKPVQVTEIMEESLDFGIKKLRVWLSTVYLDADTIGPFIKAVEMLMNRVKGPVVHRIEAKHAHLNMNKPIAAPGDPNARLEELKSKLVPRDVTPIEITPVKSE